MSKSAKEAARSAKSAAEWLRERHSFSESDETRLRWEALTSERGAWPGTMRSARESAQRNAVAIRDILTLRRIVERLGSDIAYNVEGGEPPMFARLRDLREAVEGVAAFYEVDIPERGPGVDSYDEERDEVVRFVRAYLEILTERPGAQANATDAAMIAIAYGWDDPVVDDGTDERDPWSRRIGKWRTALRRLRAESQD